MSAILNLGESVGAGAAPLAVVALGFVALAVGEVMAPARRTGDAGGRIARNVALGVGNALLALIVPVGTVAAAVVASAGGIGLFQAVPAPWWAEVAALLLARSLAAYALHRVAHAWPPLWRVHRLHHADAAVDLSTGLRSHPVEALLALLVAAGVTLALGPGVAVTIAVDVVLFLGALWQHASIALPPAIERRIEGWAMTPARHLRHHSVSATDHHGNFGDVTVLWDRLFGTLAPPARADLPVGLPRRGDG